jgi:cysteine desulfurase
MIYFDNSATTAPSMAAFAKMQEAIALLWGNPSSVHTVGNDAQKLVAQAKKEILASLGAPQKAPADANSLVFTGSGSEANNLAVFGTIRAKSRAQKPRIITTNSEHPSVLEAVRYLEARNEAEAVFLSTKGGPIDLDELKNALTSNAVLLSIMAVNNETGACYAVKEAFALAKSICPQITTHCDAVQAFGKIPVNAKTLGADLITLSAHKIHGPKGIGALYVAPHILKEKKLVPHIFGGGQENGLRSGTENTVGIAGFGAAVADLHSITKAKEVRQYILDHLPREVQANLPKTPAPHILNLTLPRIKSETMLNFLSAQKICVSAGSACASHGKHASYVLDAFGLSAAQADTSIRLSFSHENTIAQAEEFLQALQKGLQTLIRMKK